MSLKQKIERKTKEEIIQANIRNVFYILLRKPLLARCLMNMELDDDF